MASSSSFFKSLLSQKMLITLLLGFSSGLPLLLTSGTLKLWLSEAQVDITTIGYFSWVGMTHSLKFLWAPFLDQFGLSPLGRRRSWLILSQLAILLGLISIGSLDPKVSLSLMALSCIWVTFFSATQDIALDAYRREILTDDELGIGSAMNIYGYRLGMLVSGGLAVAMADAFTWSQVYIFMGLLMCVGIGVSFWAKEPSSDMYAKSRTLTEAVINPFKEFLTRHGALLILLFVFLFKLGDALSGSMLSPFYKEMGFEKTDIGLIAKTFGLASSLAGLFIGGVIIYRIGVLKSLWIFGVLQALSTASFALITYTGPEKWALAFAVIFEDVSAGMGTAAFIAYLSSITNKTYTATQFAILSSIATLGRNFFSGFAGHMVKGLGWDVFFYVCALIAIPGLCLLYIVQKKI